MIGYLHDIKLTAFPMNLRLANEIKISGRIQNVVGYLQENECEVSCVSRYNLAANSNCNPRQQADGEQTTRLQTDLQRHSRIFVTGYLNNSD